MRLNFLLVLIALVFTTNASAQYYPFYDNNTGKWGYSDSTAKILIKPRFDEVNGFFQGFASVRSGDHWGLLNKKGKWALQPVFDYVHCFDNGVVELSKAGNHTEKYIRNGKLSNTPPDDLITGLCDDVIETMPESEHEIRRYFDYTLNRWRLGKFYEDSLGAAISFPFAYFSPPIERISWFFSRYNPDNETKTGLLAWNQWNHLNAILNASYDSIRAANKSNLFYVATFFGNRNGRLAIIKFEGASVKFSETAAEFDEVKDWESESNVGRIADQWFEISSDLKTKRLLATHIDDIHPSGKGYFIYQKDKLSGLLTYRNGQWVQHPAQFTTLLQTPYWFIEIPQLPERALFEVSTPEGKKGLMTSNGVKLFR